jgi:hypothetical protein
MVRYCPYHIFGVSDDACLKFKKKHTNDSLASFIFGQLLDDHGMQLRHSA